jgi:hypothetical protein
VADDGGADPADDPARPAPPARGSDEAGQEAETVTQQPEPAGELLENAFRRAGCWPARKGHLVWLVVPLGEPSERAAEDLAARVRYLGRCPGLTAVPPRWMHIAAGEAGPAENLTAADQERLVRIVRQRCAGTAAFTVRLGPLTITPAGVVCPARPAGPLRALTRITAAARKAVPAAARARSMPAVPGGPHLVVAYATGPGATGPARELVAARRAAGQRRGLPQWHVGAVVLARMWHDGQGLAWTTVATIGLDGQPGRPAVQARHGVVTARRGGAEQLGGSMR